MAQSWRPNFFWRGGRAVDCAGLENRKAERPREFESHPLRNIDSEVFTLEAQKSIIVWHNKSTEIQPCSPVSTKSRRLEAEVAPCSVLSSNPAPLVFARQRQSSITPRHDGQYTIILDPRILAPSTRVECNCLTSFCADF